MGKISRGGKLDDRKLRFCVEYCVDCNATQAAIRAGYSKRTAQVTGSKLLQDPYVKRYVARMLNDSRKESVLKRRRLLEELAYVALFDPLDLCDENGQIVVDDMRQIPEQMRRCIAGIEVDRRVRVDDSGNEQTITKIKIKLASKIAALEMAFRHKGLFAPVETKHEHTHSGDVNVVAQLVNTLAGQGDAPDTDDPIEARLSAERNKRIAAQPDSPTTILDTTGHVVDSGAAQQSALHDAIANSDSDDDE